MEKTTEARENEVHIRGRGNASSEQIQATADRLIRKLDTSFLCKECPLSNSNTARNCVDGVGDEEAPVLFVTEFGPKPLNIGTTLNTDDVFDKIRKVVRGNGIKLNDVRYTGALRCPHPHYRLEHQNDYIQKTYIKKCRGYLQEEIEAINPKVVVLCGNVALNAAFPKRSGLAKYAGSIFQENGRIYLVTYDPIYSENFDKFQQHMSKLNLALNDELIEPDVVYKVVKNTDELKIVEKILNSVESFAFDFEVDCQLTSGHFTEEDKLLSISFCWEDKKSICIPLDHVDSPFYGKQDAHAVVKRILLNNTDKIAHNGIYDCFVAYYFYKGLKVKNYKFDTLLAHHLLDPTRGTHSLKYLASLHTNFGGYEEKIRAILEKYPLAERTYGKIPIDTLTFYNCIDTDVTFRLYTKFKNELIAEGLYDFFNDITMPTHDTILDLKIKGVYVDTDILDALQVQYAKDSEVIFKKITELDAIKDMEDLNLNSIKQLRTILYEKYKLKILKKTSSGEGSTDAATLQAVKFTVPRTSEAFTFIENYTTYKKLIKLQSTYVESFKKKIVGNYLFPDYMIFGTETGRLACVNPNLQTLPTEFDNNKLKVKSVFKAPEGFTFAELDFSQIELRNLANVTEDQNLIDAYNNNEDIHANTAKRLFDLESVDDEQRKLGKTINFSSVYGAGPGRLLNIIQTSGLLSAAELISTFGSLIQGETGGNRKYPKEILICRQLLNTFYDLYPSISTWQTRTIKETQNAKVIKSNFGRRRYIKYPQKLKALTKQQLSNMNNQTINYPIQSVSSDCLLLSLNAVHQELNKNWESYIIGTVHDSILFYIKDEELEELLPLLKKIMAETPVKYKPEFFKVPLTVDHKLGVSWGDLK